MRIDATRRGDVPPAAARCLAPRQSALRPAVARSPAKSRKVRGDRLPSCSVRPHRREIGDMAHGALERCIFPARRCDKCAVAALRRGVPRSGPGCPGRRRIATATPSCPGAPDLRRTSGVPPGNVAHRSNKQAGRTLLPSSALHQHNLLSSPCREGLRDGLSSTSLPESAAKSDSAPSLLQRPGTFPGMTCCPKSDLQSLNKQPHCTTMPCRTRLQKDDQHGEPSCPGAHRPRS